ncbi:MAG: 5'/3'-nucleotidase SurE [Acidobacteriota bacterium]
MRILLTNDDGIRAEGLAALREGLHDVGEVITVAPATEMSGVSHALTLTRPLSVHRLDERSFAVDGTPSDCVNLSCNTLLPERPTVCVSGINHGANLGDDVSYSGTVGAAIEGCFFGLPSIAVSQFQGNAQSDFDAAVTVVRDILLHFEQHPDCLPSGCFLNVNLPSEPPRGVRATRLGRRHYRDGVLQREDPRGRTYYWIGGEPVWDHEEGTDQHAVTALGCVSLSLLGTDFSCAAPGGPAPPPERPGQLQADLGELVERVELGLARAFGEVQG